MSIASCQRSDPHSRQSWYCAQRMRTSSVITGSTDEARTTAAANESIAASRAVPKLLEPSGVRIRGPRLSAPVIRRPPARRGSPR
jgi:hypothetical protein